MKAVRSKRKSRAAHPRAKAHLRAHAVYIYKLRRELEPVHCRLVGDSRLAASFHLRRVGLEAARLTISNRRGIITSREISAAMQQLSHRRNTIPMDGA
ncbi:histone H2B.1, sperm-like [Ictalurus furcatus]|uniref:histone H2B.1, sperm-like n=1 Tax=Ictalurus furcatus TaxID=66913 RepID=UPI00234FC249|nr:histone H2B.1, sperm-like [Ictalurus furcatus]